MAEVWVARKALGAKGSKFVAVKLIADHYVGDERYTRMFRSEAELAAILSHANIVQVFDEGEDDGRSYLVMEWVDGLNLLKLGAVLALLDDEERRCRVTAYIIGQLLYALGYAHSITSYDGSPLGVVHRDVSPQNVLVSNHGEVKLTDFGVAYYNVEQSSGIHVKGKVRYMSPEQISGKTRSATVDLYAVGALLHELLDGRKFRGDYEDGQDLFTAVINGEVPQLSRSIPPELDELRLRLLAPDPSDRIQTAEEAIEWLQRYPSYGDARGELTKLCSSLTGVVKPRAGPGQSGQVPMAGAPSNKGLAKPRVNPESTRSAKVPPAPSKGMAAARGVAANTGTMLESPRNSATPPVISGGTEFFEAPPIRPGKKPVGGGARGARPPAPPAAATENLAHVLARASAAALAVEHMPQPAVVPGSIPYPTTNPVSQTVVDQHSHPIPVPVPVPVHPPVAPTEFFSVADTSGALATEAIDVSAFAEPLPSGPTESPPVAVVREVTDPSREIRPQGVPQGMPPSHSIAIPALKRPGIGMLLVGLLFVAIASVTVTWWLFTRNKGEAQLAAAAGDTATSKNDDAETKSSTTSASGTKAPPAHPPEPSVTPIPSKAAGGQDDSPEPVQPDATGSDKVPTEGNGTTDTEPQEPASDAVPTGGGGRDRPRDPPSDAPKPKPKATVIVEALPAIPKGAQVRLVGLHTFDVSNGATVSKKLAVGKRKVEWRTDATGGWKAGPTVVLEPNKTIKLKLMLTGPRVLPG